MGWVGTFEQEKLMSLAWGTGVSGSRFQTVLLGKESGLRMDKKQKLFGFETILDFLER